MAGQGTKWISAEQEARKLEIESQERLRMKKMELRLTLGRLTNVGQVDKRSEPRATILDVQIPIFD